MTPTDEIVIGAGDKISDLAAKLRINCGECSGLCCVALCCIKTGGFPSTREAGVPCQNLLEDFRCAIHPELARRGLHGCLSYDCLGAGQKVTRLYHEDGDWRSRPELAGEISAVFLLMVQLHQMLWYLLEASALVSDEALKSKLDELILENERMSTLPPSEILLLDIESHRAEVNRVLKQISAIFASPSKTQRRDYIGKNFHGAALSGRDFSMSLMIAADLEDCSLQGANFLGADMRDSNIKNADLSGALFLTQMQLNCAKGNSRTRLPPKLSRPSSWE